MNDNNDYKNWLESLKIGDKIAVYHSSFNSKYYSFGTIEKITPKKAMRISINKKLLFKNGCANGSSSKWNSSWYKLEPITEELLAKLNYVKKLNAILNFKNWNKLEQPVIEKIYDLIPNI